MANRGILAAAALASLGLMPAPAFAQVRVVSNELATAGQLDVPVNKSQVLRTDRAYGKALIGNPEIADIVPLNGTSLYVLGKKIGATSLTLYDRGGGLIAVMDVAVGPDVTGLKRQLAELMPSDRIGARIANDALVLDGVVSSSVAADKAMQLAETYAPGKVVNMMSLGSSQQVMLEVRFSEVRRSALKDIGIGSFFNNGSNFGGAIGSGASLTPDANGNGQVRLGSILDSFGILTKTFGAFGLNFDAALNALEARGAITTLAEPTLVALSGETANFLAGGEFPIPVVQGGGGDNNNVGITVEYKPFGVSLAFTPTVLADGVISMIVAPEVSSLDPTASVVVNGLTIPGLQTRRAKTTVELRDGESFALAGLLRRDFQDQVRQMPVLGSLPIIGALFRSTNFQKNDTELVIVVTPRLVRPVRAGVLKVPTDLQPPPKEPNLFFMGETVGPPPAQPLPPPPPPPGSPVVGDAGKAVFDPSRLETPHGHRI
jgi:pilus assembly protein CpaC